MDTMDTMDTVDTVDTMDTMDTIDTIDTMDTIDTIDTIDTMDANSRTLLGRQSLTVAGPAAAPTQHASQLGELVGSPFARLRAGALTSRNPYGESLLQL